MKGNTLSVIRLLVIGALFIFAGRIGATPYTYYVDEIMLLGNVPGFAIDEFDDGVIAPWQVTHPSATEAGGVVALSNPGHMMYDQMGNYLITREHSEIRHNNNIGVVDGGGDLLSVSNWLPIVPEENQLYRMRMQIDSLFDADLASIHIGIFNVDDLLGDILGRPAGLNIFLTERIATRDEAIRQFFPIAAEDITDSIMFSLYFDDSLDLFTGGFSLDGGVTFHSPFDPIYVPMSEAVFDSWELSAVAFEVQSVPEPSTYLLMMTGLAGLGFARRRKIKN